MSVHWQDYAPLATAPDRAPALQQSGNIALPYPGLPAQFIVEKDAWDIPQSMGHRATTCRMISFKSATDNSLMKTFFVKGSYNGSIGLFVSFGGEYSQADLEKFLNSNDLTLSIGFMCTAITNKQISDLFRIVFTHNTIPADKLDKVKDIVTKCACEPAPQFDPSNSAENRRTGGFLGLWCGD